MLNKKLKVGDTVFVVYQKRRRETEHRTETAIVSKVGRKYAYVTLNRQEWPFYPDTGMSAEKDSNARINGWGFDVYHCREDWEQEQRQLAEYKRLKSRLVLNSWGGFVNLNPDAVAEIHAVLDKHGVAQ